jgi:hypothetical protein
VYRFGGMGIGDRSTGPIYVGRKITSGRDEGLDPLNRPGVIPVDRGTVFDVSAPVYQLDTTPQPAPAPTPTPTPNQIAPGAPDTTTGLPVTWSLGLDVVPWWGWAIAVGGAWWLFGGRKR